MTAHSLSPVAKRRSWRDACHTPSCDSMAHFGKSQFILSRDAHLCLGRSAALPILAIAVRWLWFAPCSPSQIKARARGINRRFLGPPIAIDVIFALLSWNDFYPGELFEAACFHSAAISRVSAG